MVSPRRCAIYTRKSSDEGLEQGFNSLDAQRESCEAYVKSQAAEGWRSLPAAYDDGGFSGGSMERPALKALLADIASGAIDIVVVYKVDRLTRSLSDFARIVEAFDRHDVSFVSVTQPFNTTTSMGRLTLNVLLSFAQFEREVTGERIRDKIAASKARGMWMGGVLPLGYDAPTDPQDRALQVNAAEAEIVRAIFSRYLELGSVHALERWLDESEIRSKAWTTRAGRPMGGLPFSRGALFHLLKNCTYVGNVPHKDRSYQGLHKPIVDHDVFEQVQRQLAAQAVRHRQRPLRVATMPLRGLIFDATGNPMTPSFTQKGGRSYRYYVSHPLLLGQRASRTDLIQRVSARLVEQKVGACMGHLAAGEGGAPEGALTRVELHPSTMQLVINLAAFFPMRGDPVEEVESLRGRLGAGGRIILEPGRADQARVTLLSRLKVGGGRVWFEGGASTRPPRPDPILIRGLQSAHRLAVAMGEGGLVGRPETIAPVSAPPDAFDRKKVRLAFLAPDIQRAILEGTHPPGLTLQGVLDADLPPSWALQRQMLGFPADRN